MNKGGIVTEVTWLKKVASENRTRYKSQFAALAQFMSNPRRKPDGGLDTALLDDEERQATAIENQRAFQAMTLALAAARDAKAEADADFLLEAVSRWLRRRIELTSDDLVRLLELVKSTEDEGERWPFLAAVVGAIKRVVGANILAKSEQKTLHALGKELAKARAPKSLAAKIQREIDQLCDEGTTKRLQPDEGWGDALKIWVAGLNEKVREPWESFFRDVASILPDLGNAKNQDSAEWRVSISDTGADAMTQLDRAIAEQCRMQLARIPKADWLAQIDRWIAKLGKDTLTSHLKTWLAKVPGSKPGMLVRHSLNRELLRGLLWLSSRLGDAELAQAIPRVAEFLYDINSPLGEAAVVALYHHPGKVGGGPLEVLRGRIRGESRAAFIAYVAEQFASREGLDVDDLDDGPMPAFGFTEMGVHEQKIKDVTARITIAGRKVDLAWIKKDGTAFKLLPAKFKRENEAVVDELKMTTKTVRDAVAGLCERLERSWLGQTSWEISEWLPRWIDHPVAGAVARKLIWSFESGSPPAIWSNEGWKTAQGKVVKLPKKGNASLWHPLFAEASEVLAWRNYLEAEQITQPFKQAYREVYLVTDAERATKTYSNRFAAHILRQAQLRALAKLRGWKSNLVGPWDGGDESHATRVLRHWNLRAEFWISGAGDNFQTGYQYVATDQIRFYKMDEREPMPIADVPALAFSEILRDVDLFVGTASVGNDPTWSDRGPERRFLDYWTSYSFGELTATAESRKAALQRLIPRMRIAPRCHFEDRFLVVQGELRTYKIHLGSGNILMLPNDQYLCIVADRRAGHESWMYLPFEGDSTLSIILSKALLLANDTEIKDETILRQIKEKAAPARRP